MEMISFKLSQSRDSVFVVVDPNVINEVYELHIECYEDKTFAALLCERLNQRFDSIIEEIRKEEYNSGYKHGRAKVGKKSWFSTLFKFGK